MRLNIDANMIIYSIAVRGDTNCILALEAPCEDSELVKCASKGEVEGVKVTEVVYAGIIAILYGCIFLNNLDPVYLRKMDSG